MIYHRLQKIDDYLFLIWKKIRSIGGSTMMKNSGVQVDKKIAVRYSTQGIEFDLSKRTDFFFLNNDNISFSDLILFKFSSDKPLDPKIQEKIRKYGITIYGTAPGIKNWTPTIRTIPLFLYTLIQYCRIILFCFIRHGYFSFYLSSGLISMVVRYVYWLDFFNANNVGISINSTFAGGHAQNLALSKLGGVSFAYQYSISDLHYPTSTLSNCETVQISFSDFFTRHLWREIELPADKVLNIGYIYDYFVKNPLPFDSYEKIKKQFQDNGVTFTICFFDENSLDRWDMPASNKETASDYSFLFKWLLSDPTIGMIFKPKRGIDLFARINSISQLLSEALATNRCFFLMNKTINRDIFPIQAANFADICIGKLSGATAAMEAALGNIPTYLVDVECHYTHPFYKKENHNIIFKDWPTIKETVSLFRADPELNNNLGNWSPLWEDVVSYNDGKSRDRFSDFIYYTYKAINEGAGQLEAIYEAERKLNTYETNKKNSPKKPSNLL